MMSKHTPGPWFVKNDGSSSVWDGRQYEIAVTTMIPGTFNREHKANARLIAAAPRVTEALSEMLVFFADRATTQLEIDAVNEGRGALAQAREKDDRPSRRTQHELPIPEPPDLPSIDEMYEEQSRKDEEEHYRFQKAANDGEWDDP